MQTRTNKIIFISFLAIIIVCLTIGYAVLSNKLTIGGTASVSGGGGLEVAFLKNDAKVKSEGIAICDIGTIEDTSIKDLSVTLQEDGDSCTFTIPVENLGNMTAYLTDVIGKDNSLTFDGSENNIEKIRPYVNYEVKYGEMQINSQTQFDQVAPLEAKGKEIVTLKATLNEGVGMEKMDPVTLGGFDRTFVYDAKSTTGNTPSPPTQVTTPNAPVLNGDMIPVYYDNGWKKADINNKDNTWYNYTNQKWANVVTTYDGTYQEKESEVVTLNLKNDISEVFYSTNQDVEDEDGCNSNLTLNFSTGSSSGILSFNYSVSSEQRYDKLTIKITIGDQTETIADEISGEVSGNYKKEIPANTLVKILADFYKDSSDSNGTDTATISNLTLPSDLSQELTINSTGAYPWEKKVNKEKEGYKSTNQGIDSEDEDVYYESKSNLTLDFKTGSSNGTLSFDYEVSSEENYDKLTIQITIGEQTETIADEISGEISGHCEKEIPANTKVTIIANYTKDNSSQSNDDTGYIYNIVLPDNLSEELTINSTGDYPWEKFREDGDWKYYVASRYKLNPITGKYTLENFECHNFTSDDIGKYVCLDGSNSCDGNELYKIKTIEDNTITSATKFLTQLNGGIRDKYKNASAGTPIDMSDVNTMWVWIPRYAYQINGTFGKGGADSSLPGEIEVKFLPSNIQPEENWTIPTAFNFNGSKDGFWMSKFEVTGNLEVDSCIDENCDISGVTILPGKTSLRSQNNASFFYIAKAMQKNTNIYGFTNSADLHMIKNDEWGAVTYLSQSRYGKYGNPDYTGSYEEVFQNKSRDYITGSSNGTPSQSSSIGEQYSYDNMTELGKGKGQAGPGASTTGTIYGVYDMSGGAHEKVMAVLDYNDNPMSGATIDYNSGFTGVVYEDGYYYDYTNIDFPDKKYFNEYKFSSILESNNFDNTLTACNNNICYGQALSETKNWYNDNSRFAYSEYPWLARGGRYASKEEAGIFSTTNDDGSANSSYSTRFVLVP